jgi:hypothetical protein
MVHEMGDFLWFDGRATVQGTLPNELSSIPSKIKNDVISNRQSKKYMGSTSNRSRILYSIIDNHLILFPMG